MILPLILALVGLAGCRTTGGFIIPKAPTGDLPADSTLAYSVYLIGDGGDAKDDEPTLRLMKSQLDAAGPNAAVVFLGDNIYPSGLPPTHDPYREEAERRINAQLDAVSDSEARIVFVPGNHDWGRLGIGGDRQTVRRQEEYVERVLDRGNTYLPDDGSPGPADVLLSDNILLIALDTHWWLEEVKSYGRSGPYELTQMGDVLLYLDDIIRRNSDKEIIVVGHHPVFSNGAHGGRFPTLESLFPLEMISRRYLGTPQDLSNLKYRRLRNGLLSIFGQHDGLVFAAGHEHSLQYFRHDGQHYVVSGSGSKVSYVEPGHGAAFVMQEKGYARILYYTDGSAWLEFWVPEGDGKSGRVVYTSLLKEGTRPLVAFAPPEAEIEPDDEPSVSLGPVVERDSVDLGSAPPKSEVVDSMATATPVVRGRLAREGQEPYAFFSKGTVRAAAGRRYQANYFKRLLLGKHYRPVWSTPVDVPIIDLERTAGGLTPVRRGGGYQTATLHLLGGDGDQYVLRSIDKNPYRTVPEYLRKTFVEDLVQDQISAMHPYAAFILPPMARALGIFHTEPTLVYIPYDDALGIYKDEFGGLMALFEIRPDDDQSDEERFGFAENIVGSAKLIENLAEDNDDRLDERSFARARLFDMIIGDWDRQDDQWRWARFDAEQGKIYKPVPRDRDFALYNFGGLLSRIARLSGNEQLRRLTSFARGFHDIFGLNQGGAKLDRRFLSSLTREDWLEIADSVKTELTDEVIEDAVSTFPEPVYEFHGPRIIELLKKRRDELPRAAARYYRLLAHTVDVVGSDKHERFEITRLNDEETEVVMYKTRKEGDIDRELYRRTFKKSETEEVRLYGLNGNDAFIFRGEVGNSIRVRALGGRGDDVFVDSSRVRRRDEFTFFYGRPENEMVPGRNTVMHVSRDPANNRYVMSRFELDKTKPTISLERTPDDGVLLTGGVTFIRRGFRRLPYAASHTITATGSVQRPFYDVFYTGHVTDFVGSLDARISARAVADRDFRNFYGLGNGTELADRDRFQARVGQAIVEPSLEWFFWPFVTAQFGPRYEFTSIEPPLDGPSASTGFRPEEFVDKHFAGIHGLFHIDGTDTLVNTRGGLRWLTEASVNAGVRNTSKVFGRIASEMAYFYTFDLPTQVTLAVRGGGAVNIGKFEFWQANSLGGKDNLRGYRKTRFAGRASLFGNTDLRAKLFDFNAYLANGEVGALLFFDNGRVWGGDKKSARWHPGYGGGLWISPYYQLVVTGTVAASPENVLFNLSVGFQF